MLLIACPGRCLASSRRRVTWRRPACCGRRPAAAPGQQITTGKIDSTVNSHLRELGAVLDGELRVGEQGVSRHQLLLLGHGLVAPRD